MGQTESVSPPRERPTFVVKDFPLVGNLGELPPQCKDELAAANIDPNEANEHFENLLRALLMVYETGARASLPARKAVAARLNQLFRTRYGPPVQPTQQIVEVAAEVSQGYNSSSRQRPTERPASAVSVGSPQSSVKNHTTNFEVVHEALVRSSSAHRQSRADNSKEQLSRERSSKESSSKEQSPGSASKEVSDEVSSSTTVLSLSPTSNELEPSAANADDLSEGEPNGDISEETPPNMQKSDGRRGRARRRRSASVSDRKVGTSMKIKPLSEDNDEKDDSFGDGLGSRMSHLASITIPSFEFRKLDRRYVVFVVEIETRKRMQWSVLRRYNEFYRLHEVLSQSINSLPELPPKKLMGNFEPRFLDARRKALQQYLQEICRNSLVLLHPTFRKFLTQQKIVDDETDDGANGKQESNTEVAVTENVKSKTMATKPWPELFRQDDPSQYYRSWIRIGEGAFADVYSAIDRRSEEQVAIKVIRNKFIEDRKYITREINVFNNCHHRNLVNLYHCFYFESQIWMVMEFCDCGPLIQLIPEMDFSEPRIAFVTRQLLNGLCCLHNAGYIHRDIKSQNILVSLNGRVKLADFGLCIKIEPGETTHGRVGTIHYMAPEIITRKNYDTKVDIWSIGCLIYEMCLGGPPYVKCRSLKAVFNILTHGVPPLAGQEWSDEMHDFLSLCFQVDPKQRPSAAKLLKHNVIGRAGPAKDFCKGLSIATMPHFTLSN